MSAVASPRRWTKHARFSLQAPARTLDARRQACLVCAPGRSVSREEFGSEREAMIGHQEALIYTMVLVSACDGEMTDAELNTIGDIIKHLPIFQGYDLDTLGKTAEACAELLADPAGIDTAGDLIQEALPAKLRCGRRRRQSGGTGAVALAARPARPCPPGSRRDRARHPRPLHRALGPFRFAEIQRQPAPPPGHPYLTMPWAREA